MAKMVIVKTLAHGDTVHAIVYPSKVKKLLYVAKENELSYPKSQLYIKQNNSYVPVSVFHWIGNTARVFIKSQYKITDVKRSWYK